MSASGFLNSVCRKTKLCKYFVRGRCTRQPCNFAHSIEELLPVPNLSCTKVCPTLLHSGQCNDSSCTFAHRRNELRKLPPEVSTRAPRAAEVDGASTPGPATRGFSRQVTPGELLLFEGPPGKQATGPLRQTTAPAAFPEPRGSAKGCAAEEEPAPWAWSRRPGPEGRNNKWSPKFHKTSLCIFHERGKCKRGPGCQFAHGSRELHPAPNLSRTKLCPRLLASGFCSGEDCRYAHNKEELRKLSSWSIGLDDETEDVATHPPDGEVLSPDLLCEPVPEPTHKAPHHPAPVSQPATVFDSPTHVEVRVKNTFLTVDEPSDIAPQYVKRTQSMPQLWALSCSSPAADADNETCSWPIEEEEVEEAASEPDASPVVIRASASEPEPGLAPALPPEPGPGQPPERAPSSAPAPAPAPEPAAAPYAEGRSEGPPDAPPAPPLRASTLPPRLAGFSSGGLAAACPEASALAEALARERQRKREELGRALARGEEESARLQRLEAEVREARRERGEDREQRRLVEVPVPAWSDPALAAGNARTARECEELRERLASVREVPRPQVVEKTIEVPKIQIEEKIIKVHKATQTVVDTVVQHQDGNGGLTIQRGLTLLEELPSDRSCCVLVAVIAQVVVDPRIRAMLTLAVVAIMLARFCVRVFFRQEISCNIMTDLEAEARRAEEAPETPASPMDFEDKSADPESKNKEEVLMDDQAKPPRSSQDIDFLRHALSSTASVPASEGEDCSPHD